MTSSKAASKSVWAHDGERACPGVLHCLGACRGGVGSCRGLEGLDFFASEICASVHCAQSFSGRFRLTVVYRVQGSVLVLLSAAAAAAAAAVAGGMAAAAAVAAVAAAVVEKQASSSKCHRNQQ